MIRTKIAAGSLVVAGLVAALAGPASAYDCYNASRSEQGNTKAAASSRNWWTPAEFLPAFVPCISSSDLQASLAAIAADPAVPSDFVMFFNPAHPGELASGTTPANATNFKGIDHSEDNGVLDAIITDVMLNAPSAASCMG